MGATSGPTLRNPIILGDQLLWLALLCLLRESNAPDAVFTGISKNSHFRWIGKRAAALYDGHNSRGTNA